jgi:hypothetical protein
MRALMDESFVRGGRHCRADAQKPKLAHVSTAVTVRMWAKGLKARSLAHKYLRSSVGLKILAQ